MPFTFKRKGRLNQSGRFHGCVEQLESRTLLSISPLQLGLAGPYNIPGTTWTYQVTANGTSNVAVRTVKDPTTFQNIPAYEIDTSSPSNSVVNQQYFGLNSSGNLVNYGSVIANEYTQTDVNSSPYGGNLPASITANVPIPNSYTDTTTQTDSTGTVFDTSTTQVSQTFTLTSEMTVSVNVPANTYQAYLVDSTETRMSGSGSTATTATTTSQSWYVPNIGLVKLISMVTSNGTTTTEVDELSNFQTTQEKLAFMPQPADTSTDTPIPTTVELIDSMGQLDTTSTDTVALSLNTVSGGDGAQLGGTTSLTLANGIAQFTDSNGPSINATGEYTLTATDTNTSAGVPPVNSTQFGVSDDHLEIKKQPPKKVDVLAPIPLTVELVDKQGKVDTTANTDQAQLSLEIVKDGSGAQLDGTTTLAFTNGVAEFLAGGVVSTAATALSITGVGTFKILVSDVGPNAAATPIETGEIETKGYRLGFHLEDGIHHPLFPMGYFSDNLLVATGQDVLPGSTFYIDLVDAQGERVTGKLLPSLTDSVEVIQGDGQLLGNTVASFDSSDNCNVNADVTSAGEYTFTITAEDVLNDDIPAAAIVPLKLGPLQVEGSELNAGALRYKFGYANQAFELLAGLTNHAPTSGDHFTTDYSYRGLDPTQSVGVSVALSSSTASGTLVGPGAFALQTQSTAAAGEAQGPAESPGQISEPGDYQLTFTEVVTPGGQPFDPNNFAALQGASSVIQKIVVLPERAKFAVQPRTLTVGQAFSISVVLTDASGNPFPSFDNTPDQDDRVLAIDLTVATPADAGNGVIQNPAPAIFIDGVATFSNLSFSSAGFFKLHAQPVLVFIGNDQLAADVDTYPYQALSRVIQVSNG
ncbi:MAG TPA: hypothetical protein VFE47_09500 [Tepidisphaeraceae bacterium]|jgi:hypothetical protein|nr:hypothetical protein [Tepidisphaeraceae bacterium]